MDPGDTTERVVSTRDDLVAAARSLRDQGHTSYSYADLVATARRYGSTATDRDLQRTFEEMLASPEEPAQNRDAFVEVRKGYFRLRR